MLSAHPAIAYRYWSYRYDEGDDLGTVLASITGGGVVGAGCMDYDAAIVSLDTEGDVNWEKTYPVGSSSVFHSVIEASDGECICAVGYAYISSEVGRDLYAICVDAEDGMFCGSTPTGGPRTTKDMT